MLLEGPELLVYFFVLRYKNILLEHWHEAVVNSVMDKHRDRSVYEDCQLKLGEFLEIWGGIWKRLNLGRGTELSRDMTL